MVRGAESRNISHMRPGWALEEGSVVSTTVCLGDRKWDAVQVKEWLVRPPRRSSTYPFSILYCKTWIYQCERKTFEELIVQKTRLPKARQESGRSIAYQRGLWLRFRVAGPHRNSIPKFPRTQKVSEFRFGRYSILSRSENNGETPARRTNGRDSSRNPSRPKEKAEVIPLNNFQDLKSCQYQWFLYPKGKRRFRVNHRIE